MTVKDDPRVFLAASPKGAYELPILGPSGENNQEGRPVRVRTYDLMSIAESVLRD